MGVAVGTSVGEGTGVLVTVGRIAVGEEVGVCVGVFIETTVGDTVGVQVGVAGGIDVGVCTRYTIGDGVAEAVRA